MNLRLSVAAFVLCGAAGGLCTLMAQVSRSTQDGIYTAEQAFRGRAAYSDHCLECHGRNLEGEVENRPLSGGEFLANWEGTTLLTLFDRIHKTMPADKAGTLSRAQVSDIIAFILQINLFPAGATELSTKAEVLQEIRFQLRKN